MAFASAALTHMQHEATGGRNPNLPSAVNSGLVGVTTNPNNNSYHHSKNSAPFKNVGAYTNRWFNDLLSNHPSINRDAVTGFDHSMNRADMIKATNLFLAVFHDQTDPRRKYFAEIIGTTNGTSAIRMDFATGVIGNASVDHTWHLHGAWWYLFWDAWMAADSTLSTLRGETKAQYIARHNPAPPPAPVPAPVRRRRGGMTEYLWVARFGLDPDKVHGDGGTPVWAVERPYHPDPARRWERLSGQDGHVQGGVAKALGVENTGIPENVFKAREAKYAPGGEWSAEFTGPTTVQA